MNVDTDPDHVLVVFATWQGHAQHVAERVGTLLEQAHGNPKVTIVDAAEALLCRMSVFSAVVLVTSIHREEIHPAMLEFVLAHKGSLTDIHHSAVIPSAFVSLSMLEAKVESEHVPIQERDAAAHKVASIYNEFCRMTGLRPIAAIACAVLIFVLDTVS